MAFSDTKYEWFGRAGKWFLLHCCLSIQLCAPPFWISSTGVYVSYLKNESYEWLLSHSGVYRGTILSYSCMRVDMKSWVGSTRKVRVMWRWFACPPHGRHTSDSSYQRKHLVSHLRRAIITFVSKALVTLESIVRDHYIPSKQLWQNNFKSFGSEDCIKLISKWHWNDTVSSWCHFHIIFFPKGLPMD